MCFIDYVSVYVSINHQVDLSATEIVKAKLTFEREDQSHGVVIKGYHTDNGIFNFLEFMEKLLKKQKNIRLSGAGASHQNWVAEHDIKTLVDMPSTMLINAALRYPKETLSTNLWPMAMYYALWVYNSIPDMQYGLSSI